MSPRRKFIFTVTTGRSGTAFLAELLRVNLGGDIHHERVGWDRFGYDTPDLSHITLFNSQGNVAKVKDFWRQKLTRIDRSTESIYCETSHVLAKAGLIENIDFLGQDSEVHILTLQRDLLATVRSLFARGDFLNLANIWAWYLDPRYPKNIIRASRKLSLSETLVWYVLEIRARAEFYRLLLAERANVRVHPVTLEDLVTLDGARNLFGRIADFPTDKEVIVPSPQNEGKLSALALIHAEEGSLKRAVELLGSTDFMNLAHQAYQATRP